MKCYVGIVSYSYSAFSEISKIHTGFRFNVLIPLFKCLVMTNDTVINAIKVRKEK